MAVGEIGGFCQSYYFVLTLVMENHILVREKSGNFKVDLLCAPCSMMWSEFCAGLPIGYVLNFYLFFIFTIVQLNPITHLLIIYFHHC